MKNLMPWGKFVNESIHTFDMPANNFSNDHIAQVLEMLISMIDESKTHGWIGTELSESYDVVAAQPVEKHGIIHYNGWLKNLDVLKDGIPELKPIIDKINDSIVYVWDDSLELDTFEAVALQDIHENDEEGEPIADYEYNGWYEDLAALKEKYAGTNEES